MANFSEAVALFMVQVALDPVKKTAWAKDAAAAVKAAGLSTADQKQLLDALQGGDALKVSVSGAITQATETTKTYTLG